MKKITLIIFMVLMIPCLAQARQKTPAKDITLDASGFDGNLDASVDDVQKLGEAVDDLSSVSGITGAGTVGTIPVFDTTTNIGDSLLTQSGSTVSVAGSLSATTDITIGANSVCQEDGTNCPASGGTPAGDNLSIQYNNGGVFAGGNMYYVAGDIGIGTSTPSEALHVVGNIAVSGTSTVDGRDVSVDGAKLDNIEAGAEVNNISDADATDLTDGGDTTLHDHDGISENTSFRTTPSTVITAGTNITWSGNTLNVSTGTSTDSDAIHDNVAGEITLITEKASPVSADLILIEDSADSNNKKKVQIGNLPSSGGGTWGTISGTLSNQTDLQTALDAKVDLAGDTMTGDLILTGASLGIGTTNPSQSISTSDDIFIGGDGIYTSTNNLGYIFVADGTKFSPTAVSGDITINGSGVTAIGTDKVKDSMIAWGLSATQVNSGDIPVNYIGSATYDTIKEIDDGRNSAGIIDGANITDSGSGQIDISSGEIVFKTTNSAVGENVSWDYAGTTNLAISADEDTTYIYFNYNSGAPAVQQGTASLANGRTIFNIGKVYREGTGLDIINSGLRLEDYQKRTQQHHVEEAMLHFVSGATVTETGTLNIAVSAGVMYAGLNRIVTTAIDTSGADDFEYYYNDATGWVETDETAISATQYNDYGVGLATLANNRYGVHFVYKGTEDKTYVLYGVGSYTLAGAQALGTPLNVPPHVQGFGVLRAKIIIDKNATVFTEIEQVNEIEFIPSTPSNHNDLGGIQGGAADDYYHSTSAEYTGSGTGVFVRATSPTLITPALGTPSALVGTNITGTASGLTAGTATLASTVTVVDGTDATSFVGIFDSATGNLAVKTDGALLYNASTGELSATSYEGDGSNLTGVSSSSAYSDITAPTADSTIAFGGYTNSWTSSETTADFFTIQNTATFGDISIMKLEGTGNATDGTMLEIVNSDTDVDKILVGTDDFIIKGSGNVGIGTSVPTGAFEVVSSDSTSFEVRDTSDNTLVIVESGGDVGIGTSVPATLLDVNGTITVQGNGNSCTLIVDTDGTCDSGTAMATDSSVAFCLDCS